jgi:hypothetical protein
MSVTCDKLVVFSTNKTDCHNITAILLKVALNKKKEKKYFLAASIICVEKSEDQEIIFIRFKCNVKK